MNKVLQVAVASLAGLMLPSCHRQQQPTQPLAKVYETGEVTPCSFDVLTAIELIQSRAIFPADFLKTNPRGEVPVSFVVDASGKIREARVVEALGYKTPEPAAVAAVLAAVNGLPKLQPALREGNPVAVRMTLAVRYPNPPPSKMYTPGLNRVYTFAEQMPEMPTGGGGPAIVAAIQQNMLRPQADVSGRVFVSFIIGTEGVVRDAKIVKGLGHGCDEAALAAVSKLPVLKPGKQNGCPVVVAYTVPVLCNP